eukprot:CAMPEP_0119338074 /NCGR_PEP_ID=MMETSP1333-20130426/95311_1 /TAXON_ID=418940 /ORGANISM="Scyphosphaera apsteinii, Strain RCC1455" /LENGTH=201 /DNA_ID=CAMNT_0007349269 /DNA_START=134 /DNA_END=736 /DNA_ORIENTATION=+
MRLGGRFRDSVLLRHGIPRMASRFLERVMEANLTEVIFPLAMPSLTAARLLAVTAWTIDLVYIDAAHELGETLVELHLYYTLLRPGGLVLGDDYNLFSAVKHDVDLFCKCQQLNLTLVTPSTWLIQKPEANGALFHPISAPNVTAGEEQIMVGGQRKAVATDGLQAIKQQQNLRKLKYKLEVVKMQARVLKTNLERELKKK